MTNNLKTQPYTLTWGDAAVDGLIVGEVAGAIMLIYLGAVGWLGGTDLGATLGLFDPGGGGSALAGVVSHLAVSGVYGAIFGLGWRLVGHWSSRIPVWLAGTIYGLVLLTLALFIMLPATRSPLLTISPIHLAIAHGLYGLTLGLGFGRRQPKER